MERNEGLNLTNKEFSKKNTQGEGKRANGTLGVDVGKVKNCGIRVKNQKNLNGVL